VSLQRIQQKHISQTVTAAHHQYLSVDRISSLDNSFDATISLGQFCTACLKSYVKLSFKFGPMPLGIVLYTLRLHFMFFNDLLFQFFCYILILQLPSTFVSYLLFLIINIC